MIILGQLFSSTLFFATSYASVITVKESVFEEEFIPSEEFLYDQRQDINNIEEEKFDTKVDFYTTRERKVVSDIFVEEPKDEILKNGESDEKVEFDLRKAKERAHILEGLK